MEKYTFEQIVNERIREFDELAKEAEKFSKLVTFDKKYEGTNNHFFVNHNELVLYYTYANNIIKKMYKMYLKLPWAIHGMNHVSISGSEPVQQEYRAYNNDLIFTINNVEEFRERLQSLANSPLVQELYSSYDKSISSISSMDGKTQLSFSSNSFTYFEHDNFEINFLGFDYVGLEGDSLTAPQILDIFKESTFDSSKFSEYFAKRIEMDKDKDLSIEIGSDYKVVPYTIDKEKEKTCEYFDMQKNGDKKLILVRSKF